MHQNVIPILLKALSTSHPNGKRPDSSLFVRVSDAMINLFLFAEAPDNIEPHKFEGFVHHFLACGGLDILCDLGDPKARRQDSGSDVLSPTSSSKRDMATREFDRGTINIQHILAKYLPEQAKKRAPDADEFDAIISRLGNVAISKQIEQAAVPNRKIIL